jgi:predicted DNA-binding ribbon-helix-helix protein
MRPPQHHNRVHVFQLRDGRFTSLRLEHELFRALRWLAIQQNISMAELLRQIDATPRSPSITFASAVRIYVVTTLMGWLEEASAQPLLRRARLGGLSGGR